MRYHKESREVNSVLCEQYPYTRQTALHVFKVLPKFDDQLNQFLSVLSGLHVQLATCVLALFLCTRLKQAWPVAAKYAACNGHKEPDSKQGVVVRCREATKWAEHNV